MRGITLEFPRHPCGVDRGANFVPFVSLVRRQRSVLCSTLLSFFFLYIHPFKRFQTPNNTPIVLSVCSHSLFTLLSWKTTHTHTATSSMHTNYNSGGTHHSPFSSAHLSSLSDPTTASHSAHQRRSKPASIPQPYPNLSNRSSFMPWDDLEFPSPMENTGYVSLLLFPLCFDLNWYTNDPKELIYPCLSLTKRT